MNDDAPGLEEIDFATIDQMLVFLTSDKESIKQYTQWEVDFISNMCSCRLREISFKQVTSLMAVYQTYRYKKPFVKNAQACGKTITKRDKPDGSDQIESGSVLARTQPRSNQSTYRKQTPIDPLPRDRLRDPKDEEEVPF